MSAQVQKLEALLARVRHNRVQPRSGGVGAPAVEAADDDDEVEVISLAPEPISLVPEPESLAPGPEPAHAPAPPVASAARHAPRPAARSSVPPPISAPPPAQAHARRASPFETAETATFPSPTATPISPAAKPAAAAKGPIVVTPEPVRPSAPIARAVSAAPSESASFGELLRVSLSLELR